MRAVIQRVTSARVLVEDAVTASIGRGLLVLLGVGRDDTEKDADYLAEKIAGLRICEDRGGKMNLSVTETGGEILLVSQFTLYGDARRGKRPSFDSAAPPAAARALYESCADRLRAGGLTVFTGTFQARMSVESANDGPVTILLDSARVF